MSREDPMTLTWRGIDIHNPRGTVVGKCVWCGEDAWTRGDTPFRPDLGSLPLHLICGPMMRDAYLAWKEGRTLHPVDAENMRRLAGNLAALGPGEPT